MNKYQHQRENTYEENKLFCIELIATRKRASIEEESKKKELMDFNPNRYSITNDRTLPLSPG